MTDAPTYASLRAAGAREFLTDGPNSGGVAGFIVHDGRVWRFVADWTPELHGPPMPAAHFLARWESDEVRRGYTECCAYLRSEGYAPAP